MDLRPDSGILQRAFVEVEDMIRQMQAEDPNVQVTIRASYLEIYNETVRDGVPPLVSFHFSFFFSWDGGSVFL